MSFPSPVKQLQGLLYGDGKSAPLLFRGLRRGSVRESVRVVKWGAGVQGEA